MALKRGASQWISDQPSTTFSLAPAEPARLRALELDPEPPLPFGWEKCFDLENGVIFFKDVSTGTRTSLDPRLHFTMQKSQKYSQAEFRRNLEKSLHCVTLEADEKQNHEWIMDRVQRPRREASARNEKASKLHQNISSKTLPPLLSLRSIDNLPSLELSLRLASPRAEDSSSLPTSGEKAGSLNEKAGHVKLEQLDGFSPNFLVPNHNRRPARSYSIKVKEEVTSAPSWEDQTRVVGNLSSLFPMISLSDGREGTETAATSSREQPEFRDLLGPKCAMGPFSSGNGQNVLAQPTHSSMGQSACTLEKVYEALERMKSLDDKVYVSLEETKSLSATSLNDSISMKSCNPTTNSLPPSSVASTKPRVSSSPLLQPLSSTKVSSTAAASLSPATSDASSALSCKSSLHSPTSPSVMSFQGEELDDLGGHGSTAEAKPQSIVLPSSTDLKVEAGEDPVTLVLVGCKSCLMFVMQSKDDTTCPLCGKTGLLDISPPAKRRKLGSSPIDSDMRK